MKDRELEKLALWHQHHMMTEGLGPNREWVPAQAQVFQRWHAAFWDMVSFCIMEDLDDDELPTWMTEVASDQLEANTVR